MILLCCATTMLMLHARAHRPPRPALACPAVTVAGIADPRRTRRRDRRRGERGVAHDRARDAALLRDGRGHHHAAWIRDRGEARRLMAMGAALAGGTALGYAGFASYANTVMRCDALTPGMAVGDDRGGRRAVRARLVESRKRWLRFAAAAVAGAAIAAAFAHLFPQCSAGPSRCRTSWCRPG